LSGRSSNNYEITPAVLVLVEGGLKIMFLSKLKLAAAVILIGYGAFSIAVIRGESSSSGAGQIAGRAEGLRRDGAASTTETPKPRINEARISRGLVKPDLVP
jgi:hypothetical protein